MKITQVRKKKLDKKTELKRLNSEFKEIKPLQWLKFSIFIGFIFLIIILIVFVNKINDQELIIDKENCDASNSCVNDCLNYYVGDDINHSLECRYKCLE